jgi:hypothetical protein
MALRVIVLALGLAVTVGGCRLATAPTTSSTPGTPAADLTELPPPETVPATTEEAVAPVAATPVGASGAIAATGSGTGLTPVATAEGLPADMLSPEEMAQAKELALGSAALQGLVAAAADRDELLAAQGRGAEEGELAEMLANRPSYRVMVVERLPDKESPNRLAEVAIYRYDTGEATLARIDLTTDEVTVLGAPAPYPIPVVPAEVEEAALVARANPDVRARLEASGLDPATTPANGLLTGTGDATAECSQHRCLRLFFGTRERPVPEFSVIVDMVTLQVVEVLPIAGGSANP